MAANDSVKITADGASGNSPVVVIAGADLLFCSKVKVVTEALGIQVVSYRTGHNLEELLKKASLLLVDVSSSKITASDLIFEAHQFRQSSGRNFGIVGYGPHVEVDALEMAKERGCDEVLTRSSFVEALPRLLSAVTTSAGQDTQAKSSFTGNGGKDNGAGKLTVIVFGAITAAVLYTAYYVLPFYYYYYEIQNQFEQVIAVASTESDQEIRRRLSYYIQKYDLPVLQEDLFIERDGRQMHIRLPYEEIFSVSWSGKEYVLWRFPFRAEARGEF